jgi:hypothetical protein
MDTQFIANTITVVGSGTITDNYVPSGGGGATGGGVNLSE